MTVANKFMTAHYTGKPFFVGKQKFYPLQTPDSFLLSITKTELSCSEHSEEIVEVLDKRMEQEDVDLWLTDDGKVVTLMSNAAKSALVNLKHQFVADILSHNGIYLNE